MSEIYDGVVAAVRQRLAFLEQLPACRVEEESRGLLTTIAYVVGDLTVEVSLDWRDMYPSLMVGRTMGGHRPPGYLVHFGLRVRYHLRDLLPVAADASGPDPASAAGRRRTRRARAKARTTNFAEQADRMVERIAVMAAALAESFDEVCANARDGFTASDENRALNPPPLPPHACPGLVALLEDLDSLVLYNPVLREVQRSGSATKAIPLTECPACGESLPRSLRADLHRAMAAVEPDATGVRRIPAEMHSDEWWRRRGL